LGRAGLLDELFLAFGLLQIVSPPAAIRATLKTLALALAIVTLEVYRWGSRLQSATAQHMQHALDY
jgi:hypothetical protein